jgi:hypothetical protein
VGGAGGVWEVTIRSRLDALEECLRVLDDAVLLYPSCLLMTHFDVKDKAVLVDVRKRVNALLINERKRRGLG